MGILTALAYKNKAKKKRSKNKEKKERNHKPEGKMTIHSSSIDSLLPVSGQQNFQFQGHHSINTLRKDESQIIDCQAEFNQGQEPRYFK